MCPAVQRYGYKRHSTNLFQTFYPLPGIMMTRIEDVLKAYCPQGYITRKTHTGKPSTGTHYGTVQMSFSSCVDSSKYTEGAFCGILMVIVVTTVFIIAVTVVVPRASSVYCRYRYGTSGAVHVLSYTFGRDLYGCTLFREVYCRVQLSIPPSTALLFLLLPLNRLTLPSYSIYMHAI